MSRTPLNILKETERALLLYDQDADKVFWIKKRWVDSDGALTSEGLACIKHGISKKEYDKGVQPHDPDTAGTKCVRVRVEEILDETEKAVCIACPDGSEDWLPKSTIKNDKAGDWSIADWKGEDLIVAAWAVRDKDLEWESLEGQPTGKGYLSKALESARNSMRKWIKYLLMRLLSTLALALEIVAMRIRKKVAQQEKIINKAKDRASKP